MRVYISGPITGHEDYMDRFWQAEKHLEEKNYSVINPAEISTKLPCDITYEEQLYLDMGLLAMCDAIYMLKGWHRSAGAKAELALAEKLGHEVIFQQ